MPTTIQKEWAAIDGEEIKATAETKGAVETKLREMGFNPAEYEIVALPKAHSSMFV